MEWAASHAVGLFLMGQAFLPCCINGRCAGRPNVRQDKNGHERQSIFQHFVDWPGLVSSSSSCSLTNVCSLCVSRWSSQHRRRAVCLTWSCAVPVIFFLPERVKATQTNAYAAAGAAKANDTSPNPPWCLYLTHSRLRRAGLFYLYI